MISTGLMVVSQTYFMCLCTARMRDGGRESKATLNLYQLPPRKHLHAEERKQPIKDPMEAQNQ